MPVTPDKPGPYAPASTVLEVVNRHRSKGLPPKVDAEVLGRIGISDSLIPRTLQALQTLDLIDEDGKPTPVLEGIRLAPESELQTRLKEWLTSTYSEALQFVDPASADETRIRDAFRGYKPMGQQSRMVTLFSGLFRAAGVGPEKPVPTSRNKGANQKPKGPMRIVKATRKPSLGDVPGATGAFHTGLPSALAGLLASLPKDGQRWTVSEHDAFVNTFEAVLNYCYPPKPDSDDDGAEKDEIAE